MLNISRYYRCFCRRFHGSATAWTAILNRAFIGLWLSVFAMVAFAQAPEAQKPSDVRMVIDISGSMKKNDPQNLRQPALEMLVKLLPKESKAGVWTFGQYVNMLVPHGVIDKNWVKKAESAAQEIRSIAQFTNIGEALEKAAYDHQYTDDQYQKHIILLTDGMVDIDRNPSVNQKERQRILDQVLPRYQQAGFTLHTIALSENADQQLMNKLALMTDGKSAVAKNAEELMGAFLAVFNQAVPAEELPFDGESFVTDSSIEEFTALIFRKPGTEGTKIISPDRQTYSKVTSDSRVSWHHTDKYDLVTIREPLEGEWKVIAEVEPQSRITVVSDLGLIVKTMPNNIQVDDTLDTSLVLQEEGKTITRAEFLDLLDIDVNIRRDGEAIWNKRLSDGLVPGNGVYSTKLEAFTQEGQYAVDFVVDGKTFKRQFTHHIAVLTPFSVSVDKMTKNGKINFAIEVAPQSLSIDHNQTEVVGKLKTPKGSSNIVPFVKQQDGNWTLLIAPEEEGEYLLSVRATFKNSQGQSFDYTPDALRLVNAQDGGVFEAVPSQAEKEPVQEEKTVTFEPAQEEVVEPPAEIPESEVEDDSGMMQIILYSILAVVNILIAVVVYILYRKFFKSSSAEEATEEAPEGVVEAEDNTEPEFVEPPMDEMVIEELDEDLDAGLDETLNEEAGEELSDDIDLSEDLEESTPDDPEEVIVSEDTVFSDNAVFSDDASAEEDDILSAMLDDESSDDDSDDEVPEFSLDDFAPDASDDEDKK